MRDAEELVREFCDVLSKHDPEAVRPYLTDDAVYHNVGMAQTVGADAVIADLTNQYGLFPDTYRFDIKHLAVRENVVLTERIDYLEGPAMQMAIPVMGTFVVDDGRIARWTDYFDSALIGKILGGEDTAGLIPTAW